MHCFYEIRIAFGESYSLQSLRLGLEYSGHTVTTLTLINGLIVLILVAGGAWSICVNTGWSRDNSG